MKFKKLINYEGYEISNNGTIISTKRKIPRKLKRLTDYKGYHYYRLSQNGKIKRNSIHRLVAINFIPNPENKRTVNHKN